jgi:hypothetical protein
MSRQYAMPLTQEPVSHSDERWGRGGGLGLQQHHWRRVDGFINKLSDIDCLACNHCLATSGQPTQQEGLHHSENTMGATEQTHIPNGYSVFTTYPNLVKYIMAALP